MSTTLKPKRPSDSGLCTAILAGAGTGKTRSLVKRIRQLIDKKRVRPENILALTFSNKAVNDLKSQINSSAVETSTFHALAARIVRKHGKVIGIATNFSPLDDKDTQALLGRIITSYKSEEAGCGSIGSPKTALDALEHLKSRGRIPQRADGKTTEENQIIEVYARLQEKILRMNCMTFSDLILYAIQILKENPKILEIYRKQYQHIFVDEFQDTSIAQYKLVQLLAGKKNSLTVVGDDDQCIYGFRHVTNDMLVRFKRDYNIAKFVMLTKNHRSTANIVHTAVALIGNNKIRQDKTLLPTKSDGDNVSVHRLVKQEEEAKWIAKKIGELQKRKGDSKTIAILCRTKDLFPKIEKQLKVAKIHHHVSNTADLHKHDANKIIAAYLQAVMNSQNDLAVGIVLGHLQSKGFNTQAIKRIKKYAEKMHLSYWEAMNKLKNSQQPISGLSEFVDNFCKWQEFADSNSPKKTALRIIKEAGILYATKDIKKHQAARKKLFENLDKASSLEAFFNTAIEDVNDDASNDVSAVQLMTIHASKGLQFDYVFLPAWEQGRLPLKRNNNLEEERRVAFVAITRAKEKLFISSVLEKRDGLKRKVKAVGKSQFLGELPKKHIQCTRSKSASNWLHNQKNFIPPTRAIHAGDIVSHNPYKTKSGKWKNHGIMEVTAVYGAKIDALKHDGTYVTLCKKSVTKAILPRRKT